MIFIKKIFLVVALMMAISTTTLAQWDDYYYEYVPKCEHQGELRMWQVVRYRGGMSKWDKWEGARGTLKFSKSCFEITDCNQIEISFCLSENEHFDTTDSWRLTRCDYDDGFDYVEIRPALGHDKGYYSVFIGRRDDDGNMQNTIQLVCRPLKISYPHDPNKKPTNGVVR